MSKDKSINVCRNWEITKFGQKCRISIIRKLSKMFSPEVVTLFKEKKQLWMGLKYAEIIYSQTKYHSKNKIFIRLPIKEQDELEAKLANVYSTKAIVRFKQNRQLRNALAYMELLYSENNGYFIDKNLQTMTTTKCHYPKTTYNPCKPVEKGKISSEVGWRIHPTKKNISFHRGIDISVAEGTPVKSAYAGTVHLVGWQKDEQGNTTKTGYGYRVWIRNTHGTFSAYGHLQENSSPLKEGQEINRGDYIGKSGNTGTSTGPHLHYEERINPSSPPTCIIPIAVRELYD